MFLKKRFIRKEGTKAVALNNSYFLSRINEVETQNLDV